MREPVETLRRSIIAENPLLVSMLGLAGAVVFTRDIASAVTASVSGLIVLALSSAVAFAFERVVRAKDRTAVKVVFFAAAAAMTSFCGLSVSHFFPDIWSRIGPCFPLLAVGSLPLLTAERADASLVKRAAETGACVLGYGLSLVVIAAVRQLLAGVPFMSTCGGALILCGVLAACLRSFRPAPKHEVTDSGEKENDRTDAETADEADGEIDPDTETVDVGAKDGEGE